MTDIKTIKSLLEKQGAAALKQLGQHFLVDRAVLDKIVETAGLKPSDIVLEIGPGTGILTKELAKKVKRVIAVEKDKKMCEILKEELKNFTNIEIIQDDILTLLNPKSQFPISNKIPNSKFQIPNNYKVVANIPYYLTSPLIRGFLENKFPPKEMILLIQKEVAQRICSKPPDMNLLAVSVQFYAEPKIISYVSKNSFWPKPKVDSAIIRLKVKSEKLKVDESLFFKIVKAGFSQPRKQLAPNFSKKLKLEKEQVIAWLQKNNIKPTQRAETLSIDDWLLITKNYYL